MTCRAAPVVGEVESRPARPDEFHCEICGKPTHRKRKWARFCSPTCRFTHWAKTHPRQPVGTVIVPSGSRMVLPTAVEGQAVTTDVLERAEVGAAAIVAPELAHAVSRVAELEARIAALERRPPVSILPALKPRPETWKHGANCYRNHGCRCTICVTGMREKGRARRREGY